MRQSIILILLSLLLACDLAVAEQDLSNVEEIQVLIDVSGSMKQNDPQNLRVDAVQLLINLLPENANVSLWLFAEKTTLLLHSDAVNGDWRRKALKAIQSIHSRGIYTHIEDAIQTAMQKGFAGVGQKNLVLLTDGMVDISKDIMVSADSRERVLSEWIPRLIQQQIKVQTIALSNQADKELLEKLAIDSGGWAETAASADQLQRIFLKTAQKIAPKDALPLSNNQFSVDASVQEFSLLVFKTAGASASQLIAPDQQKLGKSTAAPEVSWFESTNYDLVTVKQPKPGQWRIEAAVDPDNQVMVLTDLKLHLADIPQHINEKQALPLKLHFTEHDAIVDRADFLALVKMTVSIDGGEPIGIPAVTTEAGFFSHTLNDLPKGKHKLTFVADSKTFKREIIREIEIISSPITVEKLVDAPNRQVTLKFQPDIAVLDVNTLAIDTSVIKTNHPPESHRVEQHDNEWLLKLESLPPGESLVISFSVSAKTLDGHAVTPELLPFTIDDSHFTASHNPAPESPLTHDIEKPAEATHETTEPESDSHGNTENHWGVTIAVLLAVNLVLCGLGVLAYKILKKANMKKEQQLLERLG